MRSWLTSLIVAFSSLNSYSFHASSFFTRFSPFFFFFNPFILLTSSRFFSRSRLEQGDVKADDRQERSTVKNKTLSWQDKPREESSLKWKSLGTAINPTEALKICPRCCATSFSLFLSLSLACFFSKVSKVSCALETEIQVSYHLYSYLTTLSFFPTIKYFYYFRKLGEFTNI